LKADGPWCTCSSLKTYGTHRPLGSRGTVVTLWSLDIPFDEGLFFLAGVLGFVVTILIVIVAILVVVVTILIVIVAILVVVVTILIVIVAILVVRCSVV
jgi:hypothetical protein